MEISTCISTTTLNVNGLNAPTKRHRLPEQRHKQDLYIYSLQETHLRPKGTYRLKVRGERRYYIQRESKESWSSKLISDKTELKIEIIIKDKEGHYIMIKESIREKIITIVNIYAPNM